MVWASSHRTFAVESFYLTDEFVMLHEEFFVFISFLVEMMLFRIEFSIHNSIFSPKNILRHLLDEATIATSTT